ncbi:IclR family transcriptional regulator [Microvirga massiliensis]|uniref:IclR family transcriptional regulator n=1 Tax=Microvirga massiliensis TaxID=1033741 RepID=UPI00062B6033|nr:IclR family transcriptional regulator [Microvirga massiliensis]
MTEASNHNVRAVTRALAVLNSFAGKGLQSLAEVTAATGLDKGTTRRLLLTLMDSGFVAQDPATQHYRLGRAVRDLAANVADDYDLRDIALPVLTELAADLHVTAFLSVYDEGDVVCLARIHDMKGIEVHWWAVGGTLPYNCGGAPKLLLSYQSEEEIERVLQREPVALTPKSIVDRDKLRAALEKIRKRGWECAVDDVSIGLTALAVPVRGPSGDIACAISMAGLTPQTVQNGKPLHLKRLQAAAESVARRLRLAGGR